MLTTVGQKSPVSEWDLKSLLFMQLRVEGRDGGVTSIQKSPYSLVTSYGFLFLFLLFICGFPSSSHHLLVLL